jgi:hypothetical protein
MLALAETELDPMWLLWSHYALGANFAAQGLLKPACDHLERSIALYEPPD